MKKLLKVSAMFAVLCGVVMVVSGGWGIYFTYQNIAKEEITTPSDASIANAPVRGPFTLKAQADIIRTHALRIAGEQTYAELEREDPARETWVTALTLITALNLGIITYVFSALVVLFGLISIWTGIVFQALAKSRVD
jgi:hypothetical protein